MVVIVKSSPGTPEAKRAVKLARDMAADLMLIQNAVYMTESDRLGGFCGTVYALDEDLRLRGITETAKGVRPVSYEGLIDLITEGKTIGAF